MWSFLESSWPEAALCECYFRKPDEERKHLQQLKCVGLFFQRLIEFNQFCVSIAHLWCLCSASEHLFSQVITAPWLCLCVCVCVLFRCVKAHYVAQVLQAKDTGEASSSVALQLILWNVGFSTGPRASLSHLPSSEVSGTCHHVWNVTWVLGTSLVWLAPYHWAIFPTLQVSFL